MNCRERKSEYQKDLEIFTNEMFYYRSKGIFFSLIGLGFVVLFVDYFNFYQSWHWFLLILGIVSVLIGMLVILHAYIVVNRPFFKPIK